MTDDQQCNSVQTELDTSQPELLKGDSGQSEINRSKIVFDKVSYDYRDNNRLKLRANIDDMLLFYDLSRNRRYVMDPLIDEDNYEDRWMCMKDSLIVTQSTLSNMLLGIKVI